ncbi:helix-turn-helix domain-containing protein [Flavilitoribacter nigricans]|uniref:Transcriptional regulator n=1 Tax=Flavilitoribacter nigricans (strain ATCC 23147 / DSM 23189 / NBRC 102662 / NCIMB 1420 / SS-2) TaxID=1122177 RepID=A0A2D0N3M1_FLAN2|nr:AraC family transcriptional regulator [Flavilitoribacter nigricans]PHN02990.1 transcriptional regulator [Flavilitoribacter nigricans DSM 23189 = NBRC 102662]
MTRDIIDINDFTVLVEESDPSSSGLDACSFDEPIIGVAFYGAGNVDLSVRYGEKEKSFEHTKGLTLSFYADERVIFEHHASPEKPLECIVIATATRNLENLPYQAGELFGDFLGQLVHPQDHYVEGPQFFMTPEMQTILEQIFHNRFAGKTRMLFFKSQITALLSHFFGQLSLLQEANMPAGEREKLHQAKEILSNNLETPPSLSELSRRIGLNSYKLKKNFKELFGVPVFKYLQNERLTKAHDLLRYEDVSIQEAAWQVGYDSLSSFSNAFLKKFGFRPSEIKR